MDKYQALAGELFATVSPDKFTKEQYIEEALGFVNNRITLDKNLSRIFIEIWEISLYNKKVKAKLQETYIRWIEEVTFVISHYIDDKSYARNISIAMVAFWEGMALFSSVFPRETLNIEVVIKRFQEKLLEIF